MNDFFRTALHFRNLPAAERLARGAIAAALAALPVLWPLPTWSVAMLWASAAGVAATGFIGFCPACYLAGRNLLPRRS